MDQKAKANLRANLQALLADEMQDEPHAVEQLADLRRHPYIGRVIRQLEKEAEELSRPKQIIPTGNNYPNTDNPYDKQLVSVQEKAPEKVQRNQGSETTESAGDFCTPSREAIVADARERWGALSRRVSLLRKHRDDSPSSYLWKNAQCMPSGVRRAFELGGEAAVWASLKPDEDPFAFKARCIRGSAASYAMEDFWDGMRRREEIRRKGQCGAI